MEDHAYIGGHETFEDMSELDDEEVKKKLINNSNFLHLKKKKKLNFFGQILKKIKFEHAFFYSRIVTSRGDDSTLRFRGPFNSTNRATTRFSLGETGGFRSKHLITVKRINTGTEGKIVRAEMFARRRIIFRRGGLISAKVKGNKKWSNC